MCLCVIMDFRMKTEQTCSDHSKCFSLLHICSGSLGPFIRREKKKSSVFSPHKSYNQGTCHPSPTHYALHINIHGLFSPLNYLVMWRMKIVALWFSKFVWSLLARTENIRKERDWKRRDKQEEIWTDERSNIDRLFGAEKPKAASLGHLISVTRTQFIQDSTGPAIIVNCASSHSQGVPV